MESTIKPEIFFFSFFFYQLLNPFVFFSHVFARKLNSLYIFLLFFFSYLIFFPDAVWWKIPYSGKLRRGPPVISPKSYGGALSPEALVMTPQYFRRLNSLQMWSFRQQLNMQIRSRDLIRPENL